MHHEPYKLLRARTVIYSLILAALVTAMVAFMMLRQPVIMDVIRDRNTLYRDVGRQGIENSYTIRVINKHNQEHQYRLSVSGLDGLVIRTETEFSLAPESVYTIPTSVTAPHESAVGGNIIEFRVESLDDASIAVTEESRFRGPVGE